MSSRGAGVGFAVEEHQVRADVAIAAVIEDAAERVIVEAGRQGRVGREHVGDFGEPTIEAAAERVLLCAFESCALEIPAEVRGRFNRPHCRRLFRRCQATRSVG